MTLLNVDPSNAKKAKKNKKFYEELYETYKKFGGAAPKKAFKILADVYIFHTLYSHAMGFTVENLDVAEHNGFALYRSGYDANIAFVKHTGISVKQFHIISLAFDDALDWSYPSEIKKKAIAFMS